ncbi:hypothetical protein KDA_38170 [Dictyobacter alpinus]|uniref:HTH luxR-type domain-containing protein n=1 Tax=Dictyobacter alpinus TaxID=2014873 RepID=A0A402BAB9_9CHLR|nr:LuxR C-terminal-related transcriptional regulator [Dictyobacter alpinus]GCE28333.1 hypothetical protein KDA_38170 [Dictyobacter alpinus]
MAKAPLHLLIFSPQEQRYIVTNGSLVLMPEITASQENWVQWLNTISSFAFQNLAGERYTVRKERLQRGDAYWYAYRSIQGRTKKRYLGRTADLTIARLEEVSARFTLAEHDVPRSVPVHAQLQILETKLHPPRLPAILIDRPRLLDVLDNGRSQKLTLLCAPAGFGKTTLVLQWIARLKEQVNVQQDVSTVAWLALDRGDNDPARFWFSLIRACQMVHAQLGQAALAQLVQVPQWPFPPLHLEMILTLLLNDLARSDSPTVLVVEDYHLIEYARLHESMTFFIEHLPAYLHLIILTRSEPPLPLVRWRASGDLLDLQSTGLRFSVEESRLFFQQAIPQSLSSEVVNRLDRRLEGWAAGLRLIALNWQHHRSAQAIEEALSHLELGLASNQFIQEFFLHEVLASEAASLQLFLLQTSILDRLTGSLCDAVTGRRDSAEYLERVLRSGFFMEALEGDALAQVWYRYHGLWASTMRSEAAQRLGEDALRELALKASYWYAAHAMPVEAIEAALSAQAFEQAASFIAQLNASTYFSEHDTMCHWLEQLPEETLRTHPILCFLFVQARFFSDPLQLGWEQADHHLQVVEEWAQQQKNLALLSAIASLRATLRMNYGHSYLASAADYARHALQFLPIDVAQGNKTMERQPGVWIDWRIGSLIVIGGECMQEGYFEQARQHFLEAYIQRSGSGDGIFTNAIGMMLGDTCIEAGELHQAASYYQQMLVESDGPEDVLYQAAATCGLARISYEWNQIDAAWKQLEASEQLVQKTFEYYSDHLWIEEARTNVEILKVLLLHERGEKVRVQQHLSTLFVRLQAVSSPNILLLIPEVLTVQARLQIKDDDLTAAARTLDVLAGYEQSTFTLQQEALHLLHVRLRLAQGEGETVLPILEQLLTSSREKKHSRRAFEIQLLLAQTYFVLKQKKLAHQQLSLVLAQARHEGFMRLFLDEGNPLALLLRSLLPTLTEQPLRSYAQSILQAFIASRRFTTDPAKPFDALSAQEQRVLTLLVAGRSNPEIAEMLIVSVNTVKAHIKSLYRKLGVTNRVEAGEVARRDQLI